MAKKGESLFKMEASEMLPIVSKKADKGAQKQPKQALFAVDAEFFFGTAQEHEDGPRRDEVAEKHLLHDGELPREVDE